MLGNDEISKRLDDLLSARGAINEAKDAIVESAERRPGPDTTLASDVERFTAAFDSYQAALYDILDAVTHRIRGPLPKEQPEPESPIQL
jgi:hypothetical protein